MGCYGLHWQTRQLWDTCDLEAWMGQDGPPPAALGWPQAVQVQHLLVAFEPGHSLELQQHGLHILTSLSFRRTF